MTRPLATPALPWSAARLGDAVAAGLQDRARQDDLEQAVYGFDHLDELGLHPLVQESLHGAGYGVLPEQLYPDDWTKKRRSDAKRCDIVITPSPDQPLRDPVVKDTLFDTAAAVDAEHAYWMEIKTVAQFESGGPFPRYSAELFSPVTKDIKKLWTDSRIHFAGLLLILFTAGQDVAEHDLQAWHRRCLDKGYPVAAPVSRGFAITDRIGNAWCVPALFPVRGA